MNRLRFEIIWVDGSEPDFVEIDIKATDETHIFY